MYMKVMEDEMLQHGLSLYVALAGREAHYTAAALHLCLLLLQAATQKSWDLLTSVLGHTKKYWWEDSRRDAQKREQGKSAFTEKVSFQPDNSTVEMFSVIGTKHLGLLGTVQRYKRAQNTFTPKISHMHQGTTEGSI